MKTACSIDYENEYKKVLYEKSKLEVENEKLKKALLLITSIMDNDTQTK